MTTTFSEADHPRGTGGKFTRKAYREATEVSLAASSGSSPGPRPVAEMLGSPATDPLAVPRAEQTKVSATVSVPVDEDLQYHLDMAGHDDIHYVRVTGTPLAGTIDVYTDDAEEQLLLMDLRENPERYGIGDPHTVYADHESDPYAAWRLDEARHERCHDAAARRFVEQTGMELEPSGSSTYFKVPGGLRSSGEVHVPGLWGAPQLRDPDWWRNETDEDAAARLGIPAEGIPSFKRALVRAAKLQDSPRPTYITDEEAAALAGAGKHQLTPEHRVALLEDLRAHARVRGSEEQLVAAAADDPDEVQMAVLIEAGRWRRDDFDR
ncbi:hypothetical protein GCM10011374_35720 [Kocuria dechangensis]|uniref:Uncharacterized protein n=1 Tax=Kocuria dechangensis TaxID=1176249 RepID=A0A917H5E8_9MICC|nr:hypothetical protein [Kocuria dechangensis]GGG68233.1 hypothetical protein GCM10011374_35720 [Kocuria dechangensis]